jgi:CRISPR-associated endonuclease Csy4
MNHYFDIILLPDAEMPPMVLMNAIYAKLHKQLSDMASKTIGISFPEYRVTVGNILRLHGGETDLKILHGTNWRGGMNGYCKMGEILQVPIDAKHRNVYRKQPNMSQAKLNRLFKRGSITQQKIEGYKNKMFSERLINPPYLDLVSSTNGQRYRRYILMGELLDQPILGEFDRFGFSTQATIPWF